MSWKITADPQRFEEAIQWLLQREVITENEATRLDEDSRQRAFWIGGGLQLAQVQRVFDELNDAVANGTPFAEFRKRVRGELEDRAHAETVFRNATQRAYNAGRWRQMREVRRWRPFWKFDAILDSRTSTVCETRNGVVLHADSDWWKRNWPPLHHRCRSTVRSIREGTIGVPPNLPATPGWGLAPDHDPIWQPDPGKHDPALLGELEKKSRKPPPKPKAKPEHSPNHWTKEYSHLGDAGGAAAYGRAMYERGLDRPASEVLAELKRLKLAGHPTLDSADLSVFERLPKDKPLRGTLAGARQKGLLAFSEHTRTLTAGAPVKLSGSSNRAVDDARRFYDLTLDKAVKRPDGYRVVIQQGVRAHHLGGDRWIVLAPSDLRQVAVHELAHAIENDDARALKRSLAFLRSRTKGEALRKLKELLPHLNFGDFELARPDKFFDPYTGKDYGDFATEVTSMGYEKLTESHGLRDLAERDPEMLFFLLGQLAGK